MPKKPSTKTSTPATTIKTAQRLASHRDKALKGSARKPGITRQQYSDQLGIAPQRLTRILAGATPTLAEAYGIKRVAKIDPKAWLAAA